MKKFILREVGRPWLPDLVYSHPKVGFSIPLHLYQNDNYRQLCMQYLSNGKTSFINELFNRDALTQVIARGANANVTELGISVRRASHQLWALLQISAWAQQYSVDL